MRSFQQPSRSTAHAANGMCSTSSPLATLAGVEVLRRGGNAIDAAVTMSAVLLITEPHMTGIGGDCFAIIGRADGSLVGLNGSGRASTKADADWLASSGLNTKNLGHRGAARYLCVGIFRGRLHALDAELFTDLVHKRSAHAQLLSDISGRERRCQRFNPRKSFNVVNDGWPLGR